MKAIKVNLSDENTKNNLRDLFILIILISLFIISINSLIVIDKYEEVKTRYEKIKQDNTTLIKENQELNKLLRETLEQNDRSNNLDTRY